MQRINQLEQLKKSKKSFFFISFLGKKFKESVFAIVKLFNNNQVLG